MRAVLYVNGPGKDPNEGRFFMGSEENGGREDIFYRWGRILRGQICPNSKYWA